MAIRVLVVDDSAFVRKAVRRMLVGEPEFEVVGEAADGRRALERVRALEPDVVTLDMQMPGLGGLETLSQIMREHPVPIVLLSSHAKEGATLTLQALAAGAVDFIDKSRVSSMDVYELKSELLLKLRTAAWSRPLALGSEDVPAVEPADRPRGDLFVLGASTGGPRALQAILSRLPSDFPAAVIAVQHMPAGFTGALSRRLDDLCRLEVKEAATGDVVRPGRVLVAPGGANLTLERVAGEVRVLTTLQERSPATPLPSIDECLRSGAALYGSHLCAIILTGMGSDGVAGAREVQRAGGIIVAESETSSVVYGMPRAIKEASLASVIAPIDEIPPLMLALASFAGRTFEVM